MEEKDKTVARVDLIIVAGSILIVFGFAFFFLQNNDSSVGAETQPLSNSLFSFRSGSVIMIDNNIKFETPERIEAKDNLLIVLKRGVYYWKIADAIPEDIVLFNITAYEAVLKLKKLADGYDVVNSGNSTLNVDIYAKGKLTGSVILGSDEDEIISGRIEISG